jgi:alkylated DNA repair dioxygenase AlkB
METIELADGGILLYDEAFLSPDLADRYFAELRDTSAWDQKKAAFGHMQPRLTASYGNDGVTYLYSGTVNKALPWTPTLLEIKQKIEAVQGRYNYCLLNRYRSGADSVGMHADNEPGMGNVIGSLSLGATRMFRIRHNKTKETRTFEVSNGTLIIMAGTSPPSCGLALTARAMSTPRTTYTMPWMRPQRDGCGSGGARYPNCAGSRRRAGSW